MSDIRNPIVLIAPSQVMPSFNPNTDTTTTVQWNLWTGIPSAWDTTQPQVPCSWLSSEFATIGAAMQAVIANPASAPIACVMSFGNPRVVVDTSSVSGRSTIRLHVQNPPAVDLYTMDFDNVTGVYGTTSATYASKVAQEFVDVSAHFS